MRGRLIFPFLADFGQLDTAATQAYDPAGTPSSGYDDIYREPVGENATPTDPDGTSSRQESLLEGVPVQVEPEVLGRLQMLATGDAPDGRILLIAHFRHLERAGMVDEDGLATIRRGDRLLRIRESEPPYPVVFDPNDIFSLYVYQVQPRGFGLGRKRNLLLIELRDREAGTRA